MYRYMHCNKNIMVLKSIMPLNCAVSNHFKSEKFTKLIIYNMIFYIRKISIITVKYKIKID